jgi:Flp pilus assembly protein TadB
MAFLFGLAILGTLVALMLLRVGALKKKRAVARRLDMLSEVDGWTVDSGWSGASLWLLDLVRSLGTAKGPRPLAVGIVLVAGVFGVVYAGWIADRSGALWGMVGGTALAALAWMLGGSLLEGAARRRRDRISRALPDWVDTVACYLLVGMPFESAVGMAIRARIRSGKELKDEWFRYLQDTRLGSGRNEALVSLARRCDSEEMHRVIGAVMAAPDEREGLARSLQTCALELQANALVQKRSRDGWRLLAIAATGIGMALAIGVF